MSFLLKLLLIFFRHGKDIDTGETLQLLHVKEKIGRKVNFQSAENV